MQNFFGEILDFSLPFQIYKCYTLRKNICVKEDIPIYSRWNGIYKRLEDKTWI